MGSMYGKPLENDEQREDKQISSPRQRRRPTIPDRHPTGGYHLDEPADIPRIARASRFKAQNGKEATQQQGKNHASSYQRSTPTHRTHRSQRRFSLKDHLQSLNHNQKVLFIETLAIVMLILAPIMFT